MVPGPGSGARRRSVRSQPCGESDVTVAAAPAGYGLPLEARPVRQRVSLVEYLRSCPETVRSWLQRSGAVMFRGFGATVEELAAVITSLSGEPEPYVERSSPRTELATGVYTATDHPSHQPIFLHCESTYRLSFPAVLAFCCQVPAREGGRTPLADTRRVLARIPVDVVHRFARHGVMYVRNFGEGLGLPWQEVFQTTDREAVAAYCRAQRIEAEWRPDGGLRTRQVRPAIALHPVTGERVWFNHATFFHPWGLPADVREALLAQVATDDLPSNVYYGDGQPISAEVIDAVAAAYTAEQVAVPWAAGDVLVVDNLLAAHGRQPFTGDRRVAVAMAAPISWDTVDASQVDAR